MIGHQERRAIHVDETVGQNYKVRVGSPEGGSTLHVSLNHEQNHPGELVEVYARMGKPGAIEAGLFEAVGRLASSFLQYAAEFGESERGRAEEAIVRQLVNIQSGYPAFFKFSDSDKAVVVQSPCDGLAKAIQHYRARHSQQVDHKVLAEQEAALNHGSVPQAALQNTAPVGVTPGQLTLRLMQEAVMGKRQPSCGKCGGESWLKIDGCNVCQSCGYSKCG